MLYVAIAFLALFVLILLAIRSPKEKLEAIPDWKTLHHLLSVWIAAAAGVMTLLIPVAEQLQASLPAIDAIKSLHTLTCSPQYQTAAGMLTLFVIVARAIRQGLPKSSAPPAPKE